MGMFSTIRIQDAMLPKEYKPLGGYWQTKDIGWGDRYALRAGKLKQYFSFWADGDDHWETWAVVPFHGHAQVYQMQRDGNMVCLDIHFDQGEFIGITELYNGSNEGYWSWRTDRIGVKPE